MNIASNVIEIRRNIKAISAARIKLVDMVQQSALAVMLHAHIHGDITLANELTQAVGAGMKHEALRLYLSEFGPMNPNDDKATKAESPMKYAKAKRVGGEELDALMQRAGTVQWHDYKTEKPAEEYSFAADLHKLLAKLDKASTTGAQLTDAEQAAARALRELASTIPKPAKKVEVQA